MIFIWLFRFSFVIINGEDGSSIKQKHHILKRALLDDNITEILHENLFANYNKKLKPPGIIQVVFALNIEKIVEFLAKEEVLVMNTWINHEWLDSRLTWNPEVYGNITTIQISSDLVWT